MMFFIEFVPLLICIFACDYLLCFTIKIINDLLKKKKIEMQRFFNFKIGIAGALVMGISVFCINYFATKLLFESITAALKQSTYTFIFGGFLIKGCEFIATYFKKNSIAVLLAIAIPTIITLLLTYGLHMLKGTPKPLASTLPTLAIIPATAVWAFRKRRLIKKQF